MATMIQVTCKWCKHKFDARTADRNRGWALYCSKSCKAKEQENRTGQYRSYRARQIAKLGNNVSHDRDGGFVYINHFGEWDDHKH